MNAHPTWARSPIGHKDRTHKDGMSLKIILCFEIENHKNLQ
jgi:hypothetical protein